MIQWPFRQFSGIGAGTAQACSTGIALTQLGKITFGGPDTVIDRIDIDKKAQYAITIGGAVSTGIDMHQFITGMG